MERIVSWAQPLELLTGIVLVWGFGAWQAVGQRSGMSPGTLCQWDAEPQALARWVEAVPAAGGGGGSAHSLILVAAEAAGRLWHAEGYF